MHLFDTGKMWKLIYVSGVLFILELFVLVYAVARYEPPRSTRYKYVDEYNSHVEVTNRMVESRLSSIGELATYSYSYSGDITFTADKDWFIFNSLTESTIVIDYQGEIKAGIDISEIEIYVDNEEGVIYLTLPQPIVISNTIEATDYSEDISIFGEVAGDTSDALLDTAKEDELGHAIDDGLMDNAVDEAQEAIEDLLSVYDGYEIVFVTAE
jgi:hypothetical protein